MTKPTDEEITKATADRQPPMGGFGRRSVNVPTPTVKLGWHKTTGYNAHWKKHFVTYFYVVPSGAGLKYHEFLAIEDEDPEYLGLKERNWQGIPNEWEACVVGNKSVLRLFDEV